MPEILQETVERRVLTQGTELRVERPEGDQPRIRGYAAVFDRESHDLGGFVEVIRPGAFDRALAEGQDVMARIEHEGGLLLIGRTGNGTLTLTVDDVGLRYEVEVADTQAGRDIVTLVERRDIDKSSFAFRLNASDSERWSQRDGGIMLREILRIDELVDVAPVSSPAYEDTSVVSRSKVLDVGAGARPTRNTVRARHEHQARHLRPTA